MSHQRLENPTKDGDYVFKDGEPLRLIPLQLHSQSCYLFGREKRIADIPTDHPSCSMLLSITGVCSSSLE
ncbi:unnamed protein product [Brassica oleracea]